MKVLFKYIFIIIFITGGAYETFSQIGHVPVTHFRANSLNKSNRNTQKMSPQVRKLEAVKEGFINTKLKFSSDESEKFWPLYHQYQEELTAVRRLKRLNNSSEQANGTEQINKELYYESQLVNIRKRYKDEFLKILPPEKVSELYKSEREFNDEMIKQLSERSERAGNY